ncbi:recombinase family protein [Brevibacillus reuszeri]|uniref:recombinase family protein n=1 Tax=Brevibacillus reuszeri TaxID=54915 RepID=UPI003D1C9FE4
MEKEGLKSLIESAKYGSIEKVVTVDPSRISRNFLQAQEIEMQLKALGVDVRYVDKEEVKQQPH